MKTKVILLVLVLCILAVGAWYYFRKPAPVKNEADIYSQTGEVLRIEGSFMEMRYLTSEGVKTVGVEVPPGTPIYRVKDNGERQPSSLRLVVPGDPVVVYSKTGVGSSGITAETLEVKGR